MFKHNYDVNDLIRRARRIFDTKLTYRKIFVIIVVSCLFFLWILTHFIFGGNDKNKTPFKGSFATCIDETLTPRVLSKLNDGDVNIVGNGLEDFGIPYLNDIAYVGNGVFGTEISKDSQFHIKDGRALTLKIPFSPIVSVSSAENSREFSAVDYINGIVTRYKCFNNFHVTSIFYAHRYYPSIFVQEITFKNYRNELIDVDLTLPKIESPQWEEHSIQITQNSRNIDLQVVTGYVGNGSGKVRAVSLVYKNIPRIVTMRKRGNTNLNILMAIEYSKPIGMEMYRKTKEHVENGAVETMKKILEEYGSLESLESLRNQHTKIWNSLWKTGFYISESKAQNALNGNKINSTIYHVLSHSRSYEFEETISPQRKNQIAHDQSFAEGCFDHYHTLAAENLWKEIQSITDANNLVQTWLLTLEKQGCHNLIRAGASGIIQSMVLSFGAFRFSNQHLELNIHPEYLHRDFTFRRISYGNMTHLNISIHVRDDNKAEIEVVLDRSDRSYYACDAGCIDPPVQLDGEKKVFPVKLTEPLTSILYITADKHHIDDLRHAIHVKEVKEAPAHEHHVIFLHKHGAGNLGGLPTLFWIAICAIIIIFHVFLCKLIVKEYCEPPEIRRYRYSKP